MMRCSGSLPYHSEDFENILITRCLRFLILLILLGIIMNVRYICTLKMNNCNNFLSNLRLYLFFILYFAQQGCKMPESPSRFDQFH